MTPVVDLLGHPLPQPSVVRKDGQLRKVGYAARPGTGPKRQRCGNCEHLARVLHRGETSHKCALMAHAWTHSSATDVHRQAPACSEWERKIYPLPSTKG